MATWRSHYFAGGYVAYKEPDTALFHLQMAKSYLDEASSASAISKDASRAVSDMQLRSLLQAAEHLNKARAIDPQEALWIDDEKAGTKTKADQDYLNGEVLLHEGIAHLNASNDVWSNYKNLDGRVDRIKYRQGVSFLEQARTALEKAAQYRPYSTEVLRFLAQVYQGLGDADNFRRAVERHVELAPDDMTLHKTMKDLNAGWKPEPSFDKPPIISLNVALALCIPLGFVLTTIGGNTGIRPILSLGLLLMFAWPAFWIVKIIWRENFG